MSWVTTAMLAMPVLGPPAGAAPRDDTVVYRYEASGFCLLCDAYTITLPADGRGTVVFDARWRRPARSRTFVASRDEVRAFRRTIDRYRPRAGSSVPAGFTCASRITDQDTVAITWPERRGMASDLRVYAGCDEYRNATTVRVLSSVAYLLPVADILAEH